MMKSPASIGASVRRQSSPAQSGFVTVWQAGAFPDIEQILKQIRPVRNSDYRQMREHIRERYAAEWTSLSRRQGGDLGASRKQALIWAQQRADSHNSSHAPYSLIRQWQKLIGGQQEAQGGAA